MSEIQVNSVLQFLLCSAIIFLAWINFVLWQLATARWNQGVDTQSHDHVEQPTYSPEEHYWQDQDC